METSEEVVPFTARDGTACNLVHVTGVEPPTRGPVLLVHGAGVRANIFRAPVSPTIVDLLLEAGYDVWLENWRASIDLPPNRWTLDQAALFDHPAAVEKVVRETGAETIKALIHCQGSTSFTMSALAGLVPRVDTIVSNAVSLHPVVPRLAWLKQRVALPMVEPFTAYLDPQWGKEAPGPVARALTALVRLTHHECDNLVCRWASFTYGVGFPTLWEHDNLDDRTHEWLRDEFGFAPISFFKQIGRCLGEGRLVAYDHPEELPDDFAARPPRTDARWALFCGELNQCFLPESQRRTWEWLEEHEPGRHSLHIVPGYAHLDVFMGKDAGREVLPKMVDELEGSG